MIFHSQFSRDYRRPYFRRTRNKFFMCFLETITNWLIYFKLSNSLKWEIISAWSSCFDVLLFTHRCSTVSKDKSIKSTVWLNLLKTFLRYCRHPSSQRDAIIFFPLYLFLCGICWSYFFSLHSSTFLSYSFLLLPSAFHSSITFKIILFLILFKFLNHFNNLFIFLQYRCVLNA